MNLTLYFRLILSSIFQTSITRSKKDPFSDQPMAYENTHFYCPRVWAKDGFNISLQIHSSNYCSTENGYRAFGHTMQEVEFGFPSQDDSLLHPFSEGYFYDESDKDAVFTAVGTVGRIPITVLNSIFSNHGGIDWERTISVEAFQNLTETK